MFKVLAPLAALLAAGTAAAAGIGTAAQVQGLVTVNSGTLLASAAPGTQIVEGARVVTAANSSARLNLTTGCTVNMGPNQVLTVTMQKSCAELNLLAQNSVPNSPPAGTPPGTPPPFSGAVLTGTAATPAAVSLAAGLAAAASVRQSESDAEATPGAGGGIPNPPVSGQ